MDRDHGDIHQRPPCSHGQAGNSWPPPPPQTRPSLSSSYTCGYCKREFRSPQGLGGHMNVHRWDRARLILHQCSSHRLPSPPNPIPSRRVLDPRLSLSLLRHCSAGDGGSAAPLAKPGTGRFATMRDFFEVKNLELGIRAFGHGDGTEDRLDLELRLGV